MKPPSQTTIGLTAFVALAAADLVWLRGFAHEERSFFGLAIAALDDGIVPTANLLALGAYRLYRNGSRPHPFTNGFAVGGFLILLAYIAAAVFWPEGIQRALVACVLHGGTDVFNPWVTRFAPALGTHTRFRVSLWLMVVAVLTLPQLLFAVASGVFASWRSKRRRAAVTRA